MSDPIALEFKEVEGAVKGAVRELDNLIIKVGAVNRSDVGQITTNLKRLNQTSLQQLQTELEKLGKVDSSSVKALASMMKNSVTELQGMLTASGKSIDREWKLVAESTLATLRKQHAAALQLTDIHNGQMLVAQKQATGLALLEVMRQAAVRKQAEEAAAADRLASEKKELKAHLNGIAALAASKQKDVKAFSLDDTRHLLGLPSSSEIEVAMSELKKDILQRSAEAAATAKKIAAAKLKQVVPYSLADTRNLFGLPSEAAMSALKADILARNAEVSALMRGSTGGVGSGKQYTANLPRAAAPNLMGVMPALAASTQESTPTKLLAPTPDNVKNTRDLSSAFKQLTLDGNDVHSMARGLASGFNLLWLTWGNLVPLMAGAGISFGVKGLVSQGIEIQHTMETIRVLSEESTGAMAGLNSQLIEIAKNGPFGPLAVAEAMKTLSLAGLDAASVSASIQDVLNFAVAGTTDLKTAADVMTSVATAFSISAEGYGYVGDIIAKTAAVSKSSVESIGEAFKTSSVLAKQYGVSLEDVGVGLAALSNLGIQGSMAGTALRNMYVDLSGRTPKVTAALNKLGLELKDNAGNFKDIITLAKDLDKGLSKLTSRGEKKALMDVLSERGGKPVIELLDLVRTEATKTGDTVANKLEEMRAKIANAAGFMAISAAELAMTPANQMKSVLATLQASALEVFSGLEPTIVGLAAQLKSVFSSGEFKDGASAIIKVAANLAAGLVSLTSFVVSHAEAITKLVTLYLGLRVTIAAAATIGARYTAIKAAETAALTVNTAAAVANTAATTANNAAKVGGLTLLARAIPVVGQVVTAAGVAWMLYETFSGRSQKASEALAKSTASDTLVEKLTAETLRLEENTEAMLRNISVEELRASKEARSVSVNRTSAAGDAVVAAEADLARQLRLLETAKKGNVATAIAGREAQVAQARATVEAAKEAEVNAGEMQRLESRMVSRAKSNLQAAAAENAKTIKDKAAKEARLIGDEWQKQLSSTSAAGASFAKDTNKWVKDNLAAITAGEQQKLAALSASFTKENELRTLYRDAGMLQEGAYQTNSLTAFHAYTAKRKDLLVSSEEEIDKELARVITDNVTVREAKLALITDKDKQAADKREAIWKEYEDGVQSLGEKAKADRERLNKERLATEEEYTKRITALGLESVKAVYLAEEEFKKSKKASAAEDDKSTRVEALAAAYSHVTEGATAAALAQKAAAEAGLQATFAMEAALAVQDELVNKQQMGADAVFNNVLELMQAGKEVPAELLNTLDLVEKALERSKALRNNVAEEGAKNIVSATSKAFNKVLTDDMLKFQRGFADAIETALFEGGEAGKKKLRDLIVAELRKPITLFIQASVKALFDGTGFGGTGVGGQGGGLLGNVGTVYAAYNALSSGVKNAFSSNAASFAHSSVGQSMGLSTEVAGPSMPGMAPPTQLTGAGSSLSTAAGYAGNAIAGYGLYKGISGGYSISKGLDTVGSVASLFGPVYGAIAGGINRAFGRKLKDQGLQGQFGGDAGFTGENYQFYKGGWFRSDKIKTSALDSDTQTYLSDRFKALQVQTGLMATALGDTGQSVADFTSSIKVSFNGLTEAQIDEKLSETFATMSNDMAKDVLMSMARAEVSADAIAAAKSAGSAGLDTITNTASDMLEGAAGETGRLFANVLGGLFSSAKTVFNTEAAAVEYLAGFTKRGEDASATLARLSTNLTTVNGISDTLGWALEDVSLAGGAAASALVDAFGGLEAMTAATASYYENFYSESERAAITTRQLTEQFEGMGQTMPATREAFREMVDAAKEAGDTDLAAKLLALSPAFASVSAAVEDTAAALAASLEAAQKALAAAKTAAYNQLAASVARDRAALELQVTAATSLRDEVQAVFDTLTTSIRELRAEALGSTLSAAQGQAFITSAIAAAQSGLGLPDGTELSAAISAARGGITANGAYANSTEREFAALKLAGALSLLQASAGEQLTTAELQLQAANEQITQLDDTLAYWKRLIDGTQNGIDATLSVADAVKALQDLMFPATDTGGAVTTPPGASTGPGGVQNDRPPTTGGATTALGIWDQLDINQQVNSLSWDAQSASASAAALAAFAQSNGYTQADIAAVIGWAEKDVSSYMQNAAGIPAFAKGGYHSGGWAMVGEDGPELAYMPPAHIYTAPQTNQIMGANNSARTEALLQQLLDRIANLEAHAAATADASATTAGVLVRASAGDSLTTSAAPAIA